MGKSNHNKSYDDYDEDELLKHQYLAERRSARFKKNKRKEDFLEQKEECEEN